jgi:hypothetical protein
MNGKAEEASEGQRKTVVILSDRSREIIRLFEERQGKRQRAEHGSPAVAREGIRLMLVAIGFAIGFAAVGIAEFTQATAKKTAVTFAPQEPVRIVGPAFVPNINPREH